MIEKIGLIVILLGLISLILTVLLLLKTRQVGWIFIGFSVGILPIIETAVRVLQEIDYIDPSPLVVTFFIVVEQTATFIGILLLYLSKRA